MKRTVIAVLAPSLVRAVEAAAQEIGAELHHVRPDELLAVLDLRPAGVVLVDSLVPGALDVLPALADRAPETPVVAFVPWWDRAAERRLSDAGVAATLFRPVDTREIAGVVHALLPSPDPQLGVPWKVLVVDDDEVGLKLIRLRLTAAGFDVVTARSGLAGIAAAQAHLPDAIVCDVLMPQLDGFGFTQNIRKDPELAGVPIILISANYVGLASKRLGEDCGATAYFERTGSLKDVIDTLYRLRGERTQPHAVPPVLVDADRVHRARDAQLERLIRVNAALARMRALSDTAMSILGATASSITRRTDRAAIHGHILQLCVDSGAIVLAVLYLRGPDGTLHVEGAAGEVFIRSQAIPSPATVESLLAGLGPEGEVIALPGSMVAESAARGFLAAAHTASALIVPLRVAGEDFGALVLGSDLNDIASHDWRTFGRTLSSQLALSLALLSRVGQTTS